MLQAVLPSRKETPGLRKPTCQRTRGVPHGSMRWVLIMLRCAKPRGGAAGCRILLKHKVHMDWNEIRSWDTRLCPQIVCGCIDGYMFTHAIFNPSSFLSNHPCLIYYYCNFKYEGKRVIHGRNLRFQMVQHTSNDPRNYKVYQLKKGAVAAIYPSWWLVPKLYCFCLGSRSKPWNWVVTSEPQINW